MNKFAKMMLLAGLGALTLLPGARADQRNQKTVLTFSGPVEIPGQVLPAGTYVFKLANTQSRHIVQVYSKDERRLFSTFIALPAYRHQLSDKTIIAFDERPVGSPEAIKAWFYPGRNYGHEFVYPKTEALALAKANDTPVPSMPAELTADTTKTVVTMDGPEIAALNAAPLKTEKPSGEEAEVAGVFVVDDTEASASRSELPEKLPATATSVPLIGLIGLVSLITAAILRLTASRTN
ncbi:MAG TPA: hypothetical protein VHZ07_12455 [Bryobacteraceae bacterium]|jgi:hypothetical protein|nr:hypothetical protein [Bryobacteraceae bacterium]